MSNSVVPAAAVAHAKQLVRNKKFAKRAEDQKPAQDDQHAADKDSDAVHAVQVERADQAHASMSDTSMSSEFSFAGALSAAASTSASLTEASAQDESGATSDDGGSGAGGTVLLVGGVALAGLGVAVAVGGGGGNNNEAPTITSGGTATVAENAPITTVIYTTAATDPDGDTLTYTLSGTDAALLAISNTGVVTLKASADFETKASYSFNVVATDPDGLSATKAVVLTVTDVAENPVFTSGTTASIAENTPTTTTVYDANIAGAATAAYTLGGADAAAFNIDGATGVVTFKASPNFEAKSAYAISVTATVGALATTQAVAVSVTNVNEAPTITSAATANAVDGGDIATIVYQTVATDPDANTTLTYSLSGTDASAFNISSTGAVTLKAPADADVKASYSIIVTASDGALSDTQDVTVTVGDPLPGGETTKSIDVGLPSSSTAVVVDVSDAATTLTENANANTNVRITGFTADDIIKVTNTADFADFYTFGTTSGADGVANDLRIDGSNSALGVNNIIIIENVLVNGGLVFDYDSAVAAVGFDFMTLG